MGTDIDDPQETSFFTHADLDRTTLGKASHLATPVQSRSRVHSGGVSAFKPSAPGPPRCHKIVSNLFERSMYLGLSDKSRPSTNGPGPLARHAIAPPIGDLTPKQLEHTATDYVRPFYKGVKQIASLGPATFSKEKIRELFEAGVDVFRINLSHGVTAEVMERIREVEAEMNYPIGVLADLQGPKHRCGVFKDKAQFELKVGDHFRFDMDPEEGDAQRVQLPHPEILQVLKVGQNLLIDDGKIVMEVATVGDGWVECVVRVPGTISSRKGVNTPDVTLPITPITEKDIRDLNFILDFEPDFVALSFVQTADDIRLLRQKINEHPCKHKPKIIAKLEKPVAIENLVEIVEESNAIMVARGDLGVEMGVAQVPLIQKRIVKECRKQGVPVIVATQMLESMITCPSPTRAECSDVATAVLDGVDAVMLSGESAAGDFPRESVEMQRQIITLTENDPSFFEWERSYTYGLSKAQDTWSDEECAISAMKNLAEDIGAKCIVVLSTSGSSARRLSRLHPSIPIVAVTPSVKTARALTLRNRVYPAVLSSAWDGTRQQLSVVVDEAVSIAREKKLMKSDDDKMILIGGVPFATKGIVNFFRIIKGIDPDRWNIEE
eukprot:gnl/TRDRNA2_/TRDRNA2_177192_c0_seq5.p1 gnl/TRDRNA2_/TRDRNA2_177192_c0~~gnl/TRDRNA2_/TRDRNA2_177192_c0_seq5.p1  ORF type:complete len:645 (-),score=112.90 gnl/TRDRNA2_/TRDRNA2_177192_c0_seq5:111-1934(-)